MSSPDKIALFTKMAEADPRNELAHFNLGRLHREAGDLEQAEDFLRRTLDINPRHAQALSVLGRTLLDRGKRDEALQLLQTGVRLAHEQKEYTARNAMSEMLRAEGVEPPSLVDEAETGEVGDGMVRCRRCLQTGEALGRAPLRGELGKKIQETVCLACWEEWLAMSIKIINEYRLNLAAPQARDIYDDHMKEFLGL